MVRAMIIIVPVRSNQFDLKCLIFSELPKLLTQPTARVLQCCDNNETKTKLK